MRKKKRVDGTGTEPLSPQPAASTTSDIIVRLKRAAGDQDCPREIRELLKDAIDSIKHLRERAIYLGRQRSDSLRNNPTES